MNRDADALCRRAGPPVGAEPSPSLQFQDIEQFAGISTTISQQSPSLRFRPDGGRYHCGETDIS